MKKYNKILEAVNRGILLALDDFDDDDVLNIKSKQVYKDYTKEYLELMKDVVDLGLPSGTLWCKYNLDVDPNLLTSPEDWYGKYYAWGETEPKEKYNWETYKFGEERLLTKYCYDKQYSANYIIPRTDNLKELLPKDDVTYLNKKLHNFKFHMPTKELCEELINYTINYWVNNYDPNKTIHNPKDDGGIQGLNGRVFVGKNANLMFIPAAGYRIGSKVSNVGSECNLWTSSLFLSRPCNAYCLYFSSNNIDMYNDYRYEGYSVRPVINL